MIELAEADLTRVFRRRKEQEELMALPRKERRARRRAAGDAYSKSGKKPITKTGKRNKAKNAIGRDGAMRVKIKTRG